METDASDGVVAGVLSQLQDDGLWRPIAFFSKTMSSPQMNYDIHDKEMLAVIQGLHEWRAQLIGLQTPEPFSVLTDHRALEYFATKRELTPRQMRWAMTVADFNLKLTYRPGTANVAADALSRKQEELKTQKEKDKAARTRAFLSAEQINVNVIEDATNRLAALAAEGLLAINTIEIATSDTFMAPPPLDEPHALIDRILDANRTHESLQPIRDQAQSDIGSHWTLTGEGLLLRKGKLMVPEVNFLRTYLVRAVHATQVTAHPGARKTLKLLRDRYYWPSMSKDVSQYVAACKPCRWSHVPRDKTPGLLKSLPIPERAWQDVSMDFKSFPRDKKGYDAVFVVVDRLSKRCFSLPCHKTTTAQEAADMYYRYIWRIYGPPRSIVSDRGSQFISAFMNELCRLIGIKQKLSTAYHPQTDGNTEIVNQYLDQRLRPFVNYHQDNWSDLLPCMDWAQAILPHETTRLSPYEIEFGHQPVHHWDWEERTKTSYTVQEKMSREEAQSYAKARHDAVRLATEIARKGISRAQQSQATQANKKRREPDFTVGDEVYVTPKGFTTGRPSTKLDHQMYGPYPIIGMKGHSYQLKLPPYMRMNDVFHADRLRRASTDALPGQIEPMEEPIEVDGHPEWPVQEILDSRLYRGRLQYKAAWVAHDPDPTWYNARGFIGAPHKVRDFHKAYPDKPGPPMRLEAWLRAFETNEDLDPTEEDDKTVRGAANKATARRRK
jgi:transposase InsO family protein